MIAAGVGDACFERRRRGAATGFAGFANGVCAGLFCRACGAVAVCGAKLFGGAFGLNGKNIAFSGFLRNADEDCRVVGAACCFAGNAIGFAFGDFALFCLGIAHRIGLAFVAFAVFQAFVFVELSAQAVFAADAFEIADLAFVFASFGARVGSGVAMGIGAARFGRAPFVALGVFAFFACQNADAVAFRRAFLRAFVGAALGASIGLRVARHAGAARFGRRPRQTAVFVFDAQHDVGAAAFRLIFGASVFACIGLRVGVGRRIIGAGFFCFAACRVCWARLRFAPNQTSVLFGANPIIVCVAFPSAADADIASFSAGVVGD